MKCVFVFMGLIASSAFAQKLPDTASIHINGVNAYEVRHLLSYAAAHTGKQFEQLKPAELVEAIQLIYREDGYFLVGVSYKQVGSRLEIQVNEGEITRIDILGLDAQTSKAVHDIITTALGSGPVLLKNFERGLMLAKDLSGIKLDAQFETTGSPGKDIIKIVGTTTKSRGGVVIDNLPREFGKTIYASVSQEYYSLANVGDMLRIGVQPAINFDNHTTPLYGSLAYRTPLNSHGLYTELTAGTGMVKNYDANVAEVFGRSNYVTGLLGYPILRDVHNMFYTLSEVGHYNYSSNKNEPHLHTNLFRQTFIHSGQYASSTTRLRATVTAGVSDEDLRIQNDKNFYHLGLAAGYASLLNNRTAGFGLRLEGSAQISSSNLPLIEKFYIGDRTRMRGYALSEVVGDSGATGTVELNYHHHIGDVWLNSVSPFVFVDAGWVKNTANSAGLPYSSYNLYSAGLGVSTTSQKGFSTRAWLGVPLVDGRQTKAYSSAFWLQLTQTW